MLDNNKIIHEELTKSDWNGCKHTTTSGLLVVGGISSGSDKLRFEHGSFPMKVLCKVSYKR